MRLTRRHAIKLGAGAFATALAPVPIARAAGGCSADAFEMALPERASGAGGWRTHAPLRAPRRFHLVGLRWRSGRLRDVQVRARRRGGEWSRWVHLHDLGDHLPDGASAVRSTDPAWTGPADFVQFRHRGRGSGLRARFVRVGRAPVARSSQRRRQSASSPPAIITRDQWGAQSCPPRAPAEYGQVHVAFVHHTVSTNDYGPEDSASIVLGICRYHRDQNGWNDLGYNFLVDKYGQVFEGRAGGMDQAVIGAQAQGWNSNSTGIACIGDFSTLPQSDAGIEAVAQLIAWKLSLHGVPVTGEVTLTSAGGETNRHPAGTVVTFQRISGHRDGNSTACPGNGLYGQLQRIRDRAAQLATPVSAVSIRAASTRVRLPDALELSGELRFSDGASPGARPVQVELQTGGGAWTVIAEATTDAAGTWAASPTLDASGRVRAVFAGDAAHPRLESAPIDVLVVPRVSMKVSRNRLRRGRKVKVTARVGPKWPSRAEIVFERQTGRRWVIVQRKRVNVRGGRLRTVVRPKTRGLHRVWLKIPGVTRSRRVRAL